MTTLFFEERNHQMPAGSSRVRRSWVYGVVFVLLWSVNLSVAGPARAHEGRPPALRDVSLEQRLGARVPLDLVFQDEAGSVVRLGDYFRKTPIILVLAYYKCQNLCPLVLDGLVRSLRPLAFNVGKEFNVLTVSFDPHDSPAIAAAKKASYLQQYARPGVEGGWHFLTGDEGPIRRLAESVGFRYTHDASTGQYAHATGIMLLTPQGRIARYFYGIEFSPRDLRLGLIEAADKKIGSPIDQLLLFCYQYDPSTGKYSLLVMNVIRVAGLITMLALGSFIFVMIRNGHQSP